MWYKRLRVQIEPKCITSKSPQNLHNSYKYKDPKVCDYCTLDPEGATVALLAYGIEGRGFELGFVVPRVVP